MASLTDLPGSRQDKWRAAGASVLLFFITALLVSSSLPHSGLLIALLAVMAFAFTMLSAFGQYCGVIGTMALILATFVIGLRPEHPFPFSAYIALGAAWYYFLSLVQVYL